MTIDAHQHFWIFDPARDTWIDQSMGRLRRDFGLDADDILHTAQSLFHDHVPARAFGLANAWIDRQGLSEGGDWGATAVVGERPQFDFLFPDMASMARAVIADRDQKE